MKYNPRDKFLHIKQIDMAMQIALSRCKNYGIDKIEYLEYICSLTNEILENELSLVNLLIEKGEKIK